MKICFPYLLRHVGGAFPPLLTLWEGWILVVAGTSRKDNATTPLCLKTRIAVTSTIEKIAESFEVREGIYLTRARDRYQRMRVLSDKTARS